MVRMWLLALVLAGCAPRVDPRSPFDEDDPRAASPERAPEPVAVEVEEPTPEPARPTGPVVREGTVERAALVARLDASPGPLLRCIEVAAVEEGGKFLGWRLVRFIRGCHAFDGLDLAVGDVLVSVNGRVIIRPADLSALWAELYKAETIVAELRRAGAPILLRFTVTPAVTPPAS